MSAFVLNRGYNLQLPNSYVEIDRDEMEYVDGGYEVTKGVDVYGAWWGVQVYLNQDYTGATLAMTAGLVAIIPGVGQVVIGASVIIGAFGAAYISTNEVRVGFDYNIWAKK